MFKVTLFLSFICFLHYWDLCDAQSSIIPSYIHVCKQNDPNVDACITVSIEAIRALLNKGIPELDVPSLESLVVPDVTVSRGARFTLTGSNIIITGASNFQTKLKTDVPKNVFQIGLTIPSLLFNGKYNINARILSVSVKGQGDFTCNATNAPGDVTLTAQRTQRDGGTFFEFKACDLNLQMGTYTIEFQNIFSGNKALSDAVNSALDQSKLDFMNALRSNAEDLLKKMFLDIANKVTKKFILGDLFPES